MLLTVSDHYIVVVLQDKHIFLLGVCMPQSEKRHWIIVQGWASCCHGGQGRQTKLTKIKLQAYERNSS